MKGVTEERDKSRPHAAPLTALGSAACELRYVGRHSATSRELAARKRRKEQGGETDVMKVQMIASERERELKNFWERSKGQSLAPSSRREAWIYICVVN